MSATRPRILVVDDNPAIHEDFRKIFLVSQTAGTAELDAMEAALFGSREAAPELPTFELDGAQQGQEALAMVQAAVAEGRPYSMAFVDVRMPPGWDGIETIEHLWQADPALETAICTAYSDYSWEQIVARLGQSNQLLILKKPFDTIEVRQVATCLTAKWALARRVAAQMQDLQGAVAARTAELGATTRRLELILGSVAEGICGLDNEGRVTFMNPAGAAILGHDAQALAGRSFADQLRIPRDLLDLDAKPTIGPIDVSLGHANGSVVPVELVATRKQDGERVVGAVVLFRDQSMRRQAEATLALSRRLADEATEAQRLADLRARFVSLVTHEFRTPLATIRTAASALERYRDRMTPEQFTERTQKIEHEILRITEMVDSVLTLGQADAGMMTCAREMVDVDALCRQVVAQIEETTSRTATLVVDSLCETPQVAVDPKLVRQILGNLLTNAVKYSPAGGTVRCGIEADDRELRMRVQDEGIGIPEENQAQLFEAFHRGANVGGIPGTGLGLVVTKRAVEMHGGSIAVESVVGRGTTVTVRLPASATAEASE